MSLVDSMKKVSDNYWLYAKKMDWDYVMTLFMNSMDRIALHDELLGLYREASIIPRGLNEKASGETYLRYKMLTDKIALLETKLKEA